MRDELNLARAERLFAAFDAPGSVAAVMPERAAAASRIDSAIENQIVIDEDARPYLVGERKMLAETIARIMLETAAREGLTGEVRISYHTPYPMYGLTKFLEVAQKVTATGKQAEIYFDLLDAALMAWTRALPEAQDRMIEDEILIGLDWDGDVSTG